MTPFRQVIKPGQEGKDVTAVKRAMRAMHVPGCGTMAVDNFSGVAFVKVLKTCQRNHSLKADGIYGAGTHAVIAPHFDKYGVLLYRTAAIRKPPVPGPPVGTAAENAKLLLGYHQEGRYVARNPGDLYDIQRTASGASVWSQGGYWVHVDERVMKILVWLISKDFKIGTYAICSDHHNDGPHGHSGGRAVDIEWIDGSPVGLGTPKCRANVLEIARLLHNTPGGLAVRQLICGGYGYFRDNEISSLSIPAADSFYGSGTMAQHCNHLHVGF